jgi:hypothetical protein
VVVGCRTVWCGSAVEERDRDPGPVAELAKLALAHLDEMLGAQHDDLRYARDLPRRWPSA